MGVVCALVSCTIAYADGPVKEGNAIVGHVIEKGSEAGLPYATVLLVETGEGTVTDAGGYFRFKKLPAGEYTLKVQVNGGVQNIFNAFQKDLDKGMNRDSKYFYGPTQPRTYFIGIKFFN